MPIELTPPHEEVAVYERAQAEAAEMRELVHADLVTQVRDALPLPALRAAALPSPEGLLEPPPTRPNRYGLLVAATELPGDVRWQQGLEWLPEATEGGDVLAVNCVGDNTALDTDPNRSIIQTDPFLVYAEAHCTTLSRGFDLEGRVRRLLDITTSYEVAKEFWSGAVASGTAAGSGTVQPPIS